MTPSPSHNTQPAKCCTADQAWAMATALVAAALEDPSECYRADCRRSGAAWLEHWLQIVAREPAP